jgi:hypothetical protein
VYFHTHFKTAFKLPSSDTCTYCNEYRKYTTEKVPLQHMVRFLEAQQSYDTLKEARKNSHDEDGDSHCS